jgi:branched-chain amino acid transport system substrate-binding protein
MESKVIWLVASVLVIMGLLVSLGACAAPTTPTPTPPTPTTPAPAQPPETLKIGVLQGLNWVVGLDGVHGMDVGAERINKNGGLDVGGKKYNIELVVFDHKIDMAQVKTGAEKLVYQDKVKYILSECFCMPAIPIAEQNKVIMIASTYDASNLDPTLNWEWSGAAGSSTYPAVIPLLAKRVPDKKTFQGVFPDRFDGHLVADQHARAAKSAGLTVLEPIFYPPEATDLSAVGTKIKQLNPDILDSYGGGPPLDAGVIKAAHAAGWKGQSFGCSTVPGMVIMGIAGPEAAEGMLAIGWPTEFDPATTQMAKEFKADYIAKYGKWDDPEIVVAQELWVLLNAMQKAGSIDPEKMKPVLDSGMTFESPCGQGQMIPRPDLGNNRTVDCVTGNLPIKKITGGKVVQLETVSLQEMLGIVNKMYGIK